jgi:methylamine--corrinoid protein Co-methyltransferase
MERSLTGPVMSERDFDMKRIVMNVKKVVKEYDINFSGNNILNTDYEFVDRVWDAGIALLARTGAYSKDTGRVIEYTEAEIRDLIRLAPKEAIYGSEGDAVLEVSRTPDDTRLATNMGGSVGIPMPKEFVIPSMVSCMQEPLVDMHCPTTSMVLNNGMEIRTKGPSEIVAAWEEVELFKYVSKTMGRPGMANHGINISVSDIGQLAAGHLLKRTDSHCIGIISELKVDNTILNKIAQSVMMDAQLSPYANPIYGGLGGGLNGQLVLMTAGLIACSIIFMGTTVGTTPTHPNLFISTSRELMQITSIVFAAISRNSNIMTRLVQTMAGGPVTKTFLYEIIASTTAATKSGVSRLMGPRGATGAVTGKCTGLEARFQGEVIRAAVQLSQEQAEEIIQKAYAKYEDDLDKKPYGKSFWEAYDVNTVKPTDEWQKMYEEVKNEAIGWGLPL